MLSPLDHESSGDVLYELWMEKRQQLEDYQAETGNWPTLDMYEECNEAGDRWRCRMIGTPAPPHDDIVFQLQLKQFEVECREQMETYSDDHPVKEWVRMIGAREIPGDWSMDV